jgi:hypothetical protein
MRTTANNSSEDRVSSRTARRRPDWMRPLPFDKHGRPRCRVQNPIVGGIQDYITQPMYDSFSIGVNTAMTRQTLFQSPIGTNSKNLNNTNMVSNGTLPQPQRFIIRALRIYITNTTILSDLQNFLIDCSVVLTIGKKPYFEGFLGLLTAGMGAQLVSVANFGQLTATNPNANYSTSNGTVSQRDIYTLNSPIMLEAGETFFFVINPDTGFTTANSTASLAMPGTGATVYVILDGDLYRGVQ